MKINKDPLFLRPIAVAVAVSAACQVAYANSPFAAEPLHLIDKSTTTTLATAKPKVMLFIDDSGSMQSSVPGTPKVPCDRFKDNACSSRWDPAQGKYVWERPKNRIEVVKDAVNTVLDEYGDKIHWNIFSLWGSEDPNKWNCPGNDRSGIVYPYMNTAALRQYVDSLDYVSYRRGHKTPNYQCSGYTPATIRYLEVAKIVKDAMDYKCQTNTIVMLSDGDANGLFIDRWGRGSITADVYQALPRRGSARKDYADLDPDNIYGSLPDLYAFNGIEKDQGIAFFSHQLVDKDLKTSGVDNEGSPWDGSQVIETYTVGFGNGLSFSGKRYLEQAGAALPDKQGNPVKTYFEADDAQKLVAAFQQIFKNINDRAANTAAAVTNSVATPSNASSSIANMAATMTLNTGLWGSEIKFNKLDDDGNPVKTPGGEYVSYSAKYDGRKVLVNNGQNTYWLDKNSIPNSAYQDFGFPLDEELHTGFIPWYLRDPTKTDEQIENDVASLHLATRVVSKYRKRTETATAPARQMGDVLDSSVVAMNENAQYVVAGANDGMVYIFKSTGILTEPYALKLNYVPAGMERESATDTLGRKINVIANAEYGGGIPHIYGVNGGISYTTTAKTSDRQQRTLILGAMGQGARGVYALNISGCERQSNGSACIPVGLDADSASWNTTVPLWESEKGVGNLLGYTVGTPGLYQVALEWQDGGLGSKLPVLSQNVILAGFVSNGYPAANKALPYDSKPTLYVYNALGEEMGTNNSAGISKLGKAGEVVHKIPADSADGPGALASPVIVDIDFDGVADVAYAGDYFGDLYRFDLRNDPTDWIAVKIYDGDKSQPITSAPAVYRNNKDNLIITFGTGSNLYESDLTIRNKQGFFGIYDDLTNQNPSAATVNDLIKQQLTKTGDKRNITDLAFDPNKRGWWFELDEGFATTQGNSTRSASSEQVVTQPQILLSTVFFTTRIYKNDKSSSNLPSSASNIETCKASTSSEKSSGTSWLMGVDVRNGGTTKTAKFRDKDDPNKIDHSSGHDLGVLASQPNVVGGKLDALPDAINENAQVGSGVQLALKEGGEAVVELRNDCLVADNYHAQVSKASQAEPLETFGLTGPLCEQSGRLIRINTREIK